MVSIRRNTFETNSSSTHAMAIPKIVDDYDREVFRNRYCDEFDSLEFHLDDFGWDIRKVNHLDYLYTAIACKCIEYIKIGEDEDGYEIRKPILNPNFDKSINYIKNILDRNKIVYKFEEVDPELHWETWNIDHSEKLTEFLEAVFTDEDTLLRYLIKGLVYTGTDNCSEGDVEIWKWDFGPNYDTYYKGN